MCNDFIDTLGNTCGSHTPSLVVLELVEGLLLTVSIFQWQTGLTGLGTNNGLEFLIKCRLVYSPPLDDIKSLFKWYRSLILHIELNRLEKGCQKGMRYLFEPLALDGSNYVS
jgi:hypothetical protein